MEAVGNLGDGEGGGLQQPGGFHQQHLVDVVGDGAATHLTDDAREVGGGRIRGTYYVAFNTNLTFFPVLSLG